MSNEETKFIIMKKILLIFLLLPFISFSQSQEINGISFNAPNGFIKTGDLEWNKGNENVFVQYMKGNLIDKIQAKSACEKGSRGSDFLIFDVLEISGKNYDICIQKGKNTLLIGSTQVYKSGYTYTIIVTSNPDDYQALGYLIGYMTTRIQMF